MRKTIPQNMVLQWKAVKTSVTHFRDFEDNLILRNLDHLGIYATIIILQITIEKYGPPSITITITNVPGQLQSQ